MSNVLLTVAGLAVLIAGAEMLMRGALGASRALGISPLFSGLVIVGFGTSMPELIVSLKATLNSQPEIAIGNVVGSNIANVLLILGLCAAISPLKITPLALNRDGATFIVASVMFIAMSRNGTFGAIDGLILLSALAAYLLWAYRSEAAGEAANHHTAPETVAHLRQSKLWAFVAVLCGLLLLIAGADILLKGATGIARHAGMSDAVIGLTLVAVGTSLPELSISCIAAIRGRADIAVGNILGSNIFNVLGILGLSAIAAPLSVHPRIFQFDQWVMLGVSVLLWIFMFSARQLSRWEGGVFLVAYTVYLYLSFTLFSH